MLKATLNMCKRLEAIDFFEEYLSCVFVLYLSILSGGFLKQLLV